MGSERAVTRLEPTGTELLCARQPPKNSRHDSFNPMTTWEADAILTYFMDEASEYMHTGQGPEGNGIFLPTSWGWDPINTRLEQTIFLWVCKLVHRELQGNPFIEKLLKLASPLCLHSCASSNVFMSWYSQHLTGQSQSQMLKYVFLPIPFLCSSSLELLSSSSSFLSSLLLLA